MRQADNVNARGERRRQVMTLAGAKKSTPLWLLSIKRFVEPFRVSVWGQTHPHPLPQEGQKSLSPESHDCLLQPSLLMIGSGMGVTPGAANAPAGQ